uniref:RING-type domain-containing protein n=1 Tax=Lactuca sativa TaxID=4236 RepID=A0A9R1VBK3_LACSA|nr:hypothetical protein LSAT_V11C500295700 [Lactuca sativa]
MSSNLVVKVRRDKIAACMTCPICKKLFRDATTISECLHTFCRKCIRKKLSQEELECCPICNIDLGCVPLEKLRPDHNLQDLRAKILPYKRRRVKAPEVVVPLRRKERSLSSLVVTAPRVSPSPQTPTKTTITMTGKRSKVTPRKKSRGSSFSIEKPLLKKQQEQQDSISMEESSTSHETSNKITHNSKQKNCSTGSHDEREGGEGEAWDWKPLNDLVEAANRSKSSKLTSVVVKSEACVIKSEGGHVQRKAKGKDELSNKVEDDDDKDKDTATEVVTPPIIKMRRNRKKNWCHFNNSQDSLSLSELLLVNFVFSNGWFSLQGRGALEADRRTDGNVPVSIIQKLVMNKLELPSEHEVELRCMGERVMPTLQLRNLMELWVQAHPDIITAKIGSSAHQFLMEISYAKKPNPNPNPIPP